MDRGTEEKLECKLEKNLILKPAERRVPLGEVALSSGLCSKFCLQIWQ